MKKTKIRFIGGPAHGDWMEIEEGRPCIDYITPREVHPNIFNGADVAPSPEEETCERTTYSRETIAIGFSSEKYVRREFLIPSSGYGREKGEDFIIEQFTVFMNFLFGQQ